MSKSNKQLMSWAREFNASMDWTANDQEIYDHLESKIREQISNEIEECKDKSCMPEDWNLGMNDAAAIARRKK